MAAADAPMPDAGHVFAAAAEEAFDWSEDERSVLVAISSVDTASEVRGHLPAIVSLVMDFTAVAMAGEPLSAEALAAAVGRGVAFGRDALVCERPELSLKGDMVATLFVQITPSSPELSALTQEGFAGLLLDLYGMPVFTQVLGPDHAVDFFFPSAEALVDDVAGPEGLPDHHCYVRFDSRGASVGPLHFRNLLCGPLGRSTGGGLPLGTVMHPTYLASGAAGAHGWSVNVGTYRSSQFRLSLPAALAEAMPRFIRKMLPITTTRRRGAYVSCTFKDCSSVCPTCRTTGHRANTCTRRDVTRAIERGLIPPE